MKEIGFKLQEKRKNLKLSCEEVARLTKLPLGTIQAIEAGDLDHFQDDLTYVRFYVRSYCKAINVPYENFKDDVMDSVEEYTTTMSLNRIQEHDEIEQQVIQKASLIKKTIDATNDKGPQLAKKDRSSIAKNAQQSLRFRSTKKIDFAFLSLIVVIAVVVIIVIYVAITSLFDNGTNDTVPNNEIITDNNTTPTPEKDNSKDEDTKKQEEVKDNGVSITQSGVGSYAISGIKANEAIKMEIKFTNAGSFNLWKGNTSFAGAYGFYEAGATYTYNSTVTANEIITLNFWNFGGAEIKVNGKVMTYDTTQLVVQDGVTYFQITTKGE